MDRSAIPEDGLCLLSLDGGGPGSLSQLRIIGEYLSRLAHDKGIEVDSLFPADIFDAIGGTGFGAYIALMIGPLRMSVSQATEELVNLGIALFPPEQKEIPSAEENSKKLKEAVEAMLKRQQLPVDIKLKDSHLPGASCKVAIFASPSADAARCIPLRTYCSREQSIDCTLVEAACAALAIPPLFKPFPIGPAHRQQTFASACVGFNNPTRELVKEAVKLFGQDRRVSTMISIGSGYLPAPKIDSLSSQSAGHGDILNRIGVEAEKMSRELSSQLFNVKAYLRLNVDHGIEEFKMTDWNDLGAIEGHADAYLQGPAVSNAVDSSIRMLQDKVGLVSLGQLTWSTQVQTQAKKAPAVSPFFVVRKEYLEAMERHFILAPEAKRKIMVLSGMGGCGKTQLIAYFVEKYHSRYEHIFFVDASSASSIQTDLQSAIRALGVGYEQKTFEDAIVYLEKASHDGNWLFVLDNADNPDLDVTRYLPQCFHGSILITTRDPDLGSLATTKHLQLGSMGDIEAYETLMRAAGRTLPLSDDEHVQAKELMNELGNLPLALVQAGRYCNRMSSMTSGGDEGSFTFGQYLSLFQNHRPELMEKAEVVSLDRYGRGAYKAFDLSYSLLSQPARELLHLSGFFHHTDISLAMLEYATQSDFADWQEFSTRPETHNVIKEHLRALLRQNGRWSELQIHDTIHSLQALSLVSTTSISGTLVLRFHPLVHVWSRDALASEDNERFARMAMQTIVSCVSSPNITLYRALLPHIMTLIGKCSSDEGHVNDKMGFGRVLLDLGKYVEAETLFQKSLDIMNKEVGGNHVEGLKVKSWLAKEYQGEGRWSEAEKLQSEVLEQRKMQLGNDHEDTIEAVEELGSTYFLQGKWTDAEKMAKEVLEQRQRLLGKDHIDTVKAAGDLAATHIEQGKWKDAEKISMEVLEQRERLLSKDHLDTICAASNLAVLYDLWGKFKEAEKMQVEVLERRQRLLSKDHPDTIHAAANLASTYHIQGKWKEAEKVRVEVLEQRQRLLRKDHPHTIRALGDLAFTYRVQGRWEEAEKMEVEVLEQRQRLLSEDHPDTITAIAHLASTYHVQGNWKEAEKMQAEVLKLRQMLLSKDHPDTIWAAGDLASTYRVQGKSKEAEKMEVEVLEQRQRLLGKNHPDTITAAANLASTYYAQGRWKEVEKIQTEVLEQRQRLLHKGHPDNISATANLAMTYAGQERWREAEKLQTNAVNAAEEALGNDHPDTVLYIKNLAKIHNRDSSLVTTGQTDNLLHPSN